MNGTMNNSRKEYMFFLIQPMQRRLQVYGRNVQADKGLESITGAF
jgi:hypothetical protein